MLRALSVSTLLLISACHSPENGPPPSTPGDSPVPAAASVAPAMPPVASASAAPAAKMDEPPAGSSAPGASSESPPKLVGGYNEAAVDQQDVVETANRAVQLLQQRSGDKQLKLVRIVRAEKQVVAGRNTRLNLVLAGAKGERTVTVVVFRDLKGNESLSQVEGM